MAFSDDLQVCHQLLAVKQHVLPWGAPRCQTLLSCDKCLTYRLVCILVLGYCEVYIMQFEVSKPFREETFRYCEVLCQ